MVQYDVHKHDIGKNALTIKSNR